MTEAILRRRGAPKAKSGGEPPATVSSAATLQFTQVAFAGHNRPEDLGDRADAAADLERAFALLGQAGVVEGRLLTGLALGADLIAAEAWKAADLGPVHAVFPFLDEAADPAICDLMDAATWLDGQATEALGRNAHLAQTRWLLGAADLLVVVWTGEHARGAGGTADAVRIALEHAVPVLWIKPGEPGVLRLIRPEHLDEDFGFLEFLDELRLGRPPLVRPATAEALHDALGDLGLRLPPPEPGDDGPKPRRDRRWRTYANFRRVLGGKAPPSERLPTPPDLAEQPGFVRLTQAQAAADDDASRLGAVHRSHQIHPAGRRDPGDHRRRRVGAVAGGQAADGRGRDPAGARGLRGLAGFRARPAAPPAGATRGAWRRTCAWSGWPGRWASAPCPTGRT